MFVIEVIPLGRSTTIESLSYFSSVTYKPGTFVSIPVRGKTIKGVVASCAPVSSTKTALKAATFSLRKLPEQKNPSTIPDHLIDSISLAQKIYPISTGTLMHALLPPDVRSGEIQFPSTNISTSAEDSTPFIVAGPTSERYITYLGIIRTAFAHRGSVILIVPTTPGVQKLYEALSAGLEDRVICFASHQTKKARAAAYAAFSDLSHTTLTIVTPSFAYLDRPDCTHIIIEEAASSHYTTTHRPVFDHREILKILATLTKRTIILGDNVTRTEDEHKRRSDIYQTYSEHSKRLSLPATLTIINQTDTPTPENPFVLFSPDLKKRIGTTIESRKNVFLYAARRGLAPVVACLDCGHIFRCPDSGTPYSLLRTYNSEHVEERWFLSSTSGKRVRAADTCTACGSWRLRERGIGIQHIHNECIKLFPNVPIIVFDHTTATTHKRAVALAKECTDARGAILLGTSMVMPYLPDNLHLSAIVSLDAVRSIPTWRADETLFRLLITLREYTQNEVIVQTRNETDDLLIYAGRGAVDRFHDDEIALRKMLNYPPFADFIFISWQGSPTTVTQTETMLKHILAPHAVAPQFYTNPKSTTHKILRHCLIRVPTLSEHKTLIDTLRTLPPYIAISINPDRIV